MRSALGRGQPSIISLIRFARRWRRPALVRPVVLTFRSSPRPSQHQTRSRRAGRGLGTGRILDSMALDIAAVQAALAEDGLDGWLLYDFHGSNPIARSLAGLNGGGKMTTRRWYYLVPRIGSPRALVHAIEPNTLDTLPGDKALYAGREALAQGLDRLVEGLGRVAMEYSPENAIPYLARVDAGTVESVRNRGVEVVSSGDL